MGESRYDTGKRKYGTEEKKLDKEERYRAGKGSYNRTVQSSAQQYGASSRHASARYARQENIRRNELQRNTGSGHRNSGCRSSRYKKSQYRKRQYRRRKAVRFICFMVLCLGIIAVIREGKYLTANVLDVLRWGSIGNKAGTSAGTGSTAGNGSEYDINTDGYPEKLVELLELNGEAADYVKCYPDRESYMSQPIDLTEDIVSGQVPLLMQWDKRWGYNAYGQEMIGLAGCGPVCLDMAYLYFTGDTDMTPREMADFAYDNGYYTESGTSWSLWTEGAAKLGLRGEELSLDESAMKRALGAGGVIICSMRPGDFTTTGHIILIRGYDEDGFYVNDPNRRSNSERQWDFDTLRYQIKNLWSLKQ